MTVTLPTDIQICKENHGILYWSPQEHESCPACKALAEQERYFESELHEATFYRAN